jgi:Zn-dependent metalloprotease
MKSHFIALAVLLTLALPIQASGAGLEDRESLSHEATRLFIAAHPNARIVRADGSAIPSVVIRPGVALDKRNLSAGAHAFVMAWADMFGLDRVNGDISLYRALDVEGGTVYRFSQLHRGVTVLDTDMVVTVDATGSITTVSNGLQHVGDASAVFSTLRDDAIGAAIGWLEVSRWSGSPSRAEKVLVDMGGTYGPAWVVEFFAEQPLGLWRVLVAADEPRVLNAVNMMKNAQGYAYQDCPEAASYATVTLTNLTSSTQLTGTYLDVYSYSFGHRAKADGSGNYYITPNETTSADPFAEVTAYYNLNRMHDFFTGNNFNYLNSKVTVQVNYTSGSMACNAGSSGGNIIVGFCSSSSPKVNFAYDASVVMHEYTHSAVFATADFISPKIDDWGLNGMGAALHEGFSDSLPVVVVGNGLIGQHVGKAFGGSGLRNLNYAHTCPQDLRGESHEDGVVWGSSNWAAFKASGKDQTIGKVLLMSLTSMSSSATFKDAANVVLAAADTYGPGVKTDLQNAYSHNGVLDCGREAPVNNGAPLSTWIFSPSTMGQLGCTNCYSYSTTPGIIQYKLYVPAGATSLDINVYATDYGGSTNKTASVNVYVNQGSRVVFGSTPTAKWNTAGKSKLTITSPAAGWYWILPVGKSFGSTQGYQVAVTPEYFGVEPPDAGVDSGVAEDSGVNPDDSGAEPDGGTETDGGVSEDAQTEPDATLSDAGAPDGSGQGGDSGGVGEDAGSTEDGGESCDCDQTFACDPDCPCDPECAQSSTSGCSCSVMGVN